MTDYQKALEKLAKDKSELLFSNSSANHATIVLQTMFKYSNTSFRIYDDNLSGDLAELGQEEFYATLNNFIIRGGLLKIVVDTVKSRTNRIYTTLMNLKKEYPSQVKIAIASDSFKKEITSVYNVSVNLAIGDDLAIRIEETTHDSPSRKAICSFNSKNVTEKFIKAFDFKFNSCALLNA